MQRIHPTLVILILTLIALALRLYQIGEADYFDDEVISIFAARASVMTMASSISDYSVHPPLYYLVLHFWMEWFGTDLTTIRLLSALISTACIPAAYFLGHRLAGATAGLIGAALLAIAPFQIFHAQQARMYPLLSLLVLAATLSFLAAWQHGGWPRWTLFICCVAGGLYTHIYFPLSLLALNLWALYQSLRERQFNLARWTGLIGAQAIAGLAFLPFLPQLFGTTSSVMQGYWIRGSSMIDGVIWPILISNGSTLLNARGDQAPIGLTIIVVAAAATLLSGSYLAVRAAIRHDESAAAWELLLLLVWTPPLIASLISFLVRPILLDRSLIAILPPMYLLLAWVWIDIRRSRMATLLATVFVASMALTLALAYRVEPGQNDLRLVAQRIAVEQQPDDAVIFTEWQSFDTALLIQPDLINVYVTPSPGQSKVAYVGEQEWIDRLRYIGWPHLDRVQPVEAFAKDYRRIWLVLTNYNPGLPYQIKTTKGWLDANTRLVMERPSDRATVWLYELP